MTFWLFGQTLVSGVALGCIYGLVGIGYNTVYQTSGIVNFAQGAFFMLGGMLACVGLTKFGLPFWLAALLAIAIVGGAGLLLETVVVRRLLKQHSPLFVILLATYAANIVFEQLTLFSIGDQNYTLPSLVDWPPVMAFGVAINWQVIFILVFSLFAVFALQQFYSRTKIGLAMRACSANREAAALLGVPVFKMIGLSFVISAALGACAGILVTPITYTAFNIGLPYATNGFIAAIIGGLSSAGGALVGGIMLGVLQAVAIVLFGAAVKDITALSVLMALLVLRPEGLFKGKHRL